MVAESIHVGNGFECFHGGSPMLLMCDVTSEARWCCWRDLPWGLSNKIPREPQFTVPGGHHGVPLMGIKKPADVRARGRAWMAQSGWSGWMLCMSG